MQRCLLYTSKIQSITRYSTVAIALLQGFGYYMLMKNNSILTDTSIWAALVIIVSFVAGSSFVMWMGEQVTEFGIGNGISIILFGGILSRIPSMISGAITGLKIHSGIQAGTLTVDYVCLLYTSQWQTGRDFACRSFL